MGREKRQRLVKQDPKIELEPINSTLSEPKKPEDDLEQLDKTPLSDGVESMKWLVKLILTNLAVFLGFLTFLGFMVLRSYTGSVSNLFTLNINPTYYLMAGINVFLGYFQLLGETAKNNLAQAIIAFLVFIGLLALVMIVLIGVWFKWPRSKVYSYAIIIWLFMFLATVLVYTYGAALYSQVSPVLGGGKSSEVLFIFKDDELTSFDGILTADKTYKNRTQTVEILQERTDGWMIRDKTTCLTVFIKSDLVQAITDPVARFNPIPTLSTSPTPTITPTVIPTPTGSTSIPSPTATPHPGCKTSP